MGRGENRSEGNTGGPKRRRVGPLLIVGFTILGLGAAIILEDLYRARGPKGQGATVAAASEQSSTNRSWVGRLLGGRGPAATPEAQPATPAASPATTSSPETQGDLPGPLPGTDPDIQPPEPVEPPNPDIEPPKHNPGGVDGDRGPRELPPIPEPTQ